MGLFVLRPTSSYSASNFAYWQFLAHLAMRYLIVEHRIVYSARNLQSHPFLMSRNFETQGCQWYEIKRIIAIFAGEGNSKTRSGSPLYYHK